MKSSKRSTADRVLAVFEWIADTLFKLWCAAIAFIVIGFITMAISAHFADSDFRQLNVPYTDAMVPWMCDRIDHYMLSVFPWVLAGFLALLVLYKRVFE